MSLEDGEVWVGVFVCFSNIAIYHGGGMMYEMRSRNTFTDDSRDL